MRSFVLLSILVFFFVVGIYVSPTVSQQAGDTITDKSLYPPNAKPGQCYARVKVPEKYETYEEEVVKKQGGEEIEIVPPKFEIVEEKVLVKEASFELEIVPATYETVEENVLIKPAYEILEDIPAEYETVEEQVLIKPAQTIWKKGRGPIEKIDGSTGEILCLVEEPAQYKTITKNVLKTPAQVVKKEIPAEYSVVEKTVMKTPPTTTKVEIPAEYKTVKVKKQVAPAQEKRIAIPEEKQIVKKTKKISDGKLEWKPILCETNMTTQVIKEIQVALKSNGYYFGPVDGVVGPGTISGLRLYQDANGLATGGITLESLKTLGVKM